MDEAQKILLSSLNSSGISLPSGISSTKDLNPDALVSICAQSLRLIDDSSPKFPTSLPVSAAERFKISADVASAIRSLGYRDNLSFHQFLYPSDEDSNKLVRFLVERLSESSEVRKAIGSKAIRSNSNTSEASNDSGTSKLKETADKVGESQSNKTVADGVHLDGLHACVENMSPPQSGGSVDTERLSSEDSEYVESCEKEHSHSNEFIDDLSEDSINKVTCFHGGFRNVAELEQKLASLHVQLSKLRYKVENSKSREQIMMAATHAKTLEIQNLEGECELLKSAAKTGCSDQDAVGFYVKGLKEKVEARRQNITELKSQWNALNQTLEEREVTPQQSLQSLEPQVQEKLNQLKEIDREVDVTISEIRKREVEHSELLVELEKQPKISSRKSYIERITEITKNSWKQDADIDRILQETRALRLESNSIQERLHRTYALVDEAVFREAKKDAVGRQVYRLLTSIHDSFEQLSEKILATDRARREAAEQEAKLAAMSSRNFDVNKLQSDLDSIRKENEFLEQQLRHD